MAGPALVPGQRIGSLRVERLLGRGGIAEVWLVQDVALGLPLALKVLVARDPEWIRRLQREGRAQHGLRHPNVVQVHGSLSVEGQPALLMDYVPGTDLRCWLQACLDAGTWPALPEALLLFRGILAGVEAAHARGLVHRDLKPANVLLDLTGPTPVPRLTDFGVVKDLAGDGSTGDMTQARVVVGTRGYLAPEQIEALRDVDARADVFALGCLLYLLCCRREAFWDDDEVISFRRVMAQDYPDPLAVLPSLPVAVAEAIRGCLVVDREARLASCGALRERLDALEPPRAARLTEVNTAQVRQGPRWAPLLAAAGLGAALGAGLFTGVDRLVADSPPAEPASSTAPPPAVAAPAPELVPVESASPPVEEPAPAPPVSASQVPPIDPVEPAPPPEPEVIEGPPLWGELPEEAAKPASPWGEQQARAPEPGTATAALWATAPPPEPPRLGRVLVQGSPQPFCLRATADGHETCEHRVPAGTWEVLLRQPDGSHVPAGTVVVQAGQVTTMVCDPEARLCR